MLIPTTYKLKRILLESCNTLHDRQELITMEALEESRIDNALVADLYRKVLEKSNIDFDTIPDSKGDITKYTGYTTIVQTMEIVNKLAKQSNVKIKELEIVQTALNNIITFRPQFVKGFIIDNGTIKILYNSLVAACVEASSTIIASYVEYIKTPNKVDFTIIKGINKMSHTSISSLQSFNDTVKSNEFSKFINQASSSKDNLLGEALLGAVVLISSSAVIVTVLREFVYYFYYSRMKISEYLKFQAQLLEFNKVAVQSSMLSADKKRKVIQKQLAIAKSLEQISDKIAVDNRMSDKTVSNTIDKENRSVSYQDIKSQSLADGSEGFIL